MKRILPTLITAILFYCNANAQTAPTSITASNIDVNKATISWQASTAIPSTATKIESFEQPFFTQSWTSDGYN